VVLDVACGTADLAVAFAAAGAGRVIGLDFVHAMLRLARQKAGRRSHQGCAVELICGDATSLPLADHSVDIVSIAFGLRNVDQPDQALREFARVLRPGGRLMILEFAQPTVPLLGRLFRFYFHHVMPRTATWISGDRAGAYRYLPQSVRSFHTPEEIAARIETQGMTVRAQRRFSLGIAVATLAYQDD
jgi:demethylmenaquinone methyltransferase/2-methoxy-6-polyprenyl-1,4-benzoquinol methylase